MNDLPDLLTTRQTCQVLGISRPTLYRLMQRGVLKPLPRARGVGSSSPLRFRKEDVVQLLTDERHNPEE